MFLSAIAAPDASRHFSTRSDSYINEDPVGLGVMKIFCLPSTLSSDFKIES